MVACGSSRKRAKWLRSATLKAGALAEVAIKSPRASKTQKLLASGKFCNKPTRYSVRSALVVLASCSQCSFFTRKANWVRLTSRWRNIVSSCASSTQVKFVASLRTLLISCVRLCCSCKAMTAKAPTLTTSISSRYRRPNARFWLSVGGGSVRRGNRLLIIRQTKANKPAWRELADPPGYQRKANKAQHKRQARLRFRKQVRQ